VSSRDFDRLENLLDSPAHARLPAASALMGELRRADVLPQQQMPADVVTMGSTVECSDEISGERHALTLVYPDEADVDAGRVSVLTPVGSALLGLSVGQGIDWDVPGGRHLRLRVNAVRYQPEADGALDR
jgi:regulator of nucleoside diphosphate kinase